MAEAIFVTRENEMIYFRNKNLHPSLQIRYANQFNMDYSSFDILKYPVLPVAEGYKEWAATYEQTVQDEMDLHLLSRIKTVDWTKIETALDFACGTGRIGVWLKEHSVGQIDGVDITPEMLVKAEEKKVYRSLLNVDVLNTQLPDGSYDLTIQSLADEHYANVSPLYLEASRLTKDEGYFVIVGYHPFFLMNGLITHFHKENGEPSAIESYVHLFSDHVKAALQHNFILSEMDEAVIDDDWLRKKPKWGKYKNRPVSFSMVWQKIRTGNEG
jgi:ubiquinone/menaquinone biosynthesis C-methylase UbiE